MAQTNPETTTSTNPRYLPEKLTYEEFLTKYDGRSAEYVGSGVIEPMTVTKTHNKLTNFLSSLMQVFVQQKDIGQIFGEPYQMKMKIGGEIRGRAPDIFYVKNENLDRIGEQFFEGGADLVIEIVSSDSLTRDTKDKFGEYEKAGVGEYWIIDPNRQTAKFYGFDKDGKYQLLPVSNNGRFESLVISGLWIETEWLWREKLPNIVGILKQWELV